MVGKVVDVYVYHQLGCGPGPIPGMASGHAQASSSASSAVVSASSPAVSSADSPDASGADSLMRPASIFTCGFSAMTRYSDGRVDAAAASIAAAMRALFASRVTAPTDAIPASTMSRGPPGDSIFFSRWRPPGRSAPRMPGSFFRRMLRNLLLSRVGQATTWLPCAAVDLCRLSLRRASGTGGSESGMPSAVLAMTAASRSSVFASPGEQLGLRAVGRRFRVGDRQAGETARYRERPIAAGWSTTTGRPAPIQASSSSGSCSVLAAMGSLQRLALPGHVARLMGELPDVDPLRRLGRWRLRSAWRCPSDRRSIGALPARHPHHLAVALLDGGARRFPIGRQKQRRLSRRQSLGTYVNRSPTVKQVA